MELPSFILALVRGKERGHGEEASDDATGTATGCVRPVPVGAAPRALGDGMARKLAEERIGVARSRRVRPFVSTGGLQEGVCK